MKLLRYGQENLEKPGILDSEGNIRDLSGEIADIDGETLQPEILARLTAIDVSEFPLVPNNPRLGCPVSGIGKIMCIGKNYVEHAKETGSEPPKQPMLFMKATSALTGPFDNIVIPRNAQSLIGKSNSPS